MSTPGKRLVACTSPSGATQVLSFSTEHDRFNLKIPLVEILAKGYYQTLLKTLWFLQPVMVLKSGVGGQSEFERGLTNYCNVKIDKRLAGVLCRRIGLNRSADELLSLDSGQKMS